VPGKLRSFSGAKEEALQQQEDGRVSLKARNDAVAAVRATR